MCACCWVSGLMQALQRAARCSSVCQRKPAKARAQLCIWLLPARRLPPLPRGLLTAAAMGGPGHLHGAESWGSSGSEIQAASVDMGWALQHAGKEKPFCYVPHQVLTWKSR